MISNRIHNACNNDDSERGWALLGLILALGIMSMVLVSTVVPSVRFQVQRDKEAEMMYRGEQMAEAIARYYNRGRLTILNFRTPPPPYGYLLELDKLVEGVNDGPIERRFARLSAMTDPLMNADWEPVRVGDPRIAIALNIYASQPNVFIPQDYWLFAGPPAPTISVPGTSEESEPSEGTGGTTGQGGASGTVSGTGTAVPPTGQPQPPAQPQQPTPPRNQNQGNNQRDPLEQFFRDDVKIESRPIVGVATTMKGPSVRAYKGILNYGEMIFIYLPDQREAERLVREQQQNQRNNQNRGNRGNQRGNQRVNPGAGSTRDP
ncbi:MAG: hypothetical protein L0229_29565 [Blastocatellia bacterium]|nr:hypothetical protein [Blastocatellia bacterium]